MQTQLASVQQLLTKPQSSSLMTAMQEPGVCPLETPRAGKVDPSRLLEPYAIDDETAALAHASSNSRSSYAISLAKQLFTLEERITSNCRGIGKKSLQPSKLLAIKIDVFEKFPIDLGQETMASAITELRNAIDTHCRGLKKSLKKLQ